MEVDRCELVGGDRGPADRPHAVLELRRRPWPQHDGRDARVPQDPRDRELREALPPPGGAERLLEWPLRVVAVASEPAGMGEPEPGARAVEGGEQVLARVVLAVR